MSRNLQHDVLVVRTLSEANVGYTNVGYKSRDRCLEVSANRCRQLYSASCSNQQKYHLSAGRYL